MTATGLLLEAAIAAEDDPRSSHAAVRAIVDWAGCAVGGAAHEGVEALAAALPVFGESDLCTLAGRRMRAPPFGAALVNGAASHVLDFDDVNIEMIGHPAVVVVPAALALAEVAHRDGATLIAAVARGYETATVLGRLVNPRHYERGWHATATLGCVAAAMASSRVLGLDDIATHRAVGLAATQAGGVRAVFGSQGKAFHAGRAASAGLLAATMAGRGTVVADDVLEADAGYFSVAGEDAAGRLAAVAAASRGADPAILATAFKGHAACGATHCLIDAVGAVVGEEGLAAGDIVAINARVHRLAIRAAGIPRPSTPLEAKFSLRHTAALAAHTYPLLPSAFTDETFAPPEVVALRERVIVTEDETMRYDQAMPADVTITTNDGRTFRRRVEAPRGRPANPMTDDELAAKFTRLASPVLGAGATASVLETLWSLPVMPDVAHAARMLAA